MIGLLPTARGLLGGRHHHCKQLVGPRKGRELDTHPVGLCVPAKEVVLHPDPIHLNVLLEQHVGEAVDVTSLAEVTQVWSLTQFISVDLSQSRIGVKECVLHKRKIKVCVSCC